MTPLERITEIEKELTANIAKAIEEIKQRNTESPDDFNVAADFSDLSQQIKAVLKDNGYCTQE